MEAIKFMFGNLELTNEVINRLSDLGYTPESLKEAIKNHEQTNGSDYPAIYCGYTPESLKDEINKHELKHDSDSPALYCGTYSKYNSGNLRGMWVNVSTFDSYEDFINFCKAIHADEEYPELMYQDFENMPGSLYHESMGKEEFNNLLKYCELCEEYDVFAVYDFLEWRTPEDLDDMHDAYVGVYDSKEDFAEEIVSECYDLEKTMGDLACYFDYEKFARDLFMCDYYFGSHGTVFSRF